MRITTTTEDTGLSESTYELISGTDTESQDGNYTESMSNSIASLDFHRPDDVHSLADTEHTCDDESLAESEVYPPPSRDPQDQDQQDTIILDRRLPISQQKTAEIVESTSKSIDEANSQSLEYTKQHLDTPSILTPEASGIVERPVSTFWLDDEDDQDEGYYAKTKRTVSGVLWLSGITLQALAPSLITVAIIVLGCGYFLNDGAKQVAPLVPAAPPAVVSSVISTTVVSTSKVSTLHQVTATSTRAAALVPFENVLPDDWLFPSKKTELYLSKHNGDYLIHVDPAIKYHCLSVKARRGDDPVKVDIVHVENGLLLKFPYEETVGTVRVEVASRCRPKIRQVLEIPFGERWIVEDAVEKARHLVQGVCDHIPLAAQEAERRFEETKRTLGSASNNALLASNDLLKDWVANLHQMHRSLGVAKAGARKRIRDMKEGLSKKVDAAADTFANQLPDTRDIQDQARLGLLDAQLSAKILWLKLTGDQAKHDEYKKKANAFLSKKLAEVKTAQRVRLGLRDDASQPDLWSKLFGEAATCRRNIMRGHKVSQECLKAMQV